MDSRKGNYIDLGLEIENRYSINRIDFSIPDKTSGICKIEGELESLPDAKSLRMGVEYPVTIKVGHFYGEGWLMIDNFIPGKVEKQEVTEKGVEKWSTTKWKYTFIGQAESRII